ncbi:hypothetical protein K438DRAFT_1703693 [Mycena galopus ATCC 62051]|nr:hypothetical protein K438DRAFT_1703693 [Mycena galopus ATCC 62051]
MTSRPAKRQRPEAAIITRSEIWHTDGNVVLQAQDMQFRVHWGILTQNSSFFRDLQALPQPPEQLTVDGCAVLELQLDAVEDVKLLLATLYNPTALFQQVIPFALVAALVRLGRKYDFRNLMDAAVQLLMDEHPTTLKEFLELSKTHPYHPKRITYHRGFELDMLDLARENNILSALPCAYYRMLTRYSQNQLLDGIPRSDRTLTSLAPSTLRQCIVGREKIIFKQMQPGHTLGWLWEWEYDADCYTRSKCHAYRKVLIQKYFQFVGVRAFGPVEKMKPRFCHPCFHHIEELMNMAQRKMWEDLPAFFDLPPWGELKNYL